VPEFVPILCPSYPLSPLPRFFIELVNLLRSALQISFIHGIATVKRQSVSCVVNVIDTRSEHALKCRELPVDRTVRQTASCHVMI
jgi:hypothetical protein